MDFGDHVESLVEGLCPDTVSDTATSFERTCSTLKTGLAGAMGLAEPFSQNVTDASVCIKGSEAHPPVYEIRSGGFSPLGGFAPPVREVGLPKP